MIWVTLAGRGVFASQSIPSSTVIDISPVLIFTPDEVTQHAKGIVPKGTVAQVKEKEATSYRDWIAARPPTVSSVTSTAGTEFPPLPGCPILVS